MSFNHVDQKVKQKIKSVFGNRAIFGEELKKHTTFGVGGQAEIFVRVLTERELLFILRLASLYKVKSFVLGYGSNVLVSDKGFNGIVISLRQFCGYKIENGILTAKAGTGLNKLICSLKKVGLSGLEHLYGIPASIGGAVAINAGAFGVEISNSLISVRAISNNKIVEFDKNQCNFKYRDSRFLQNSEIITEARFNLVSQEESAIDSVIKALMKERRKKPLTNTCGSVFKNPNGSFAGELIERAGLKGYSIGKAKISNLHANYIECQKGALAIDIYLLIKKIQNTVKDKFDILLEPEVKFIGDFK